MKQLILLLFYPALIIAPKSEGINIYAEFSLKKRNILVKILIDKMVAFIRYIVTHGSTGIGVPPLDPFEMDSIHLVIPTGLFNFDLQLKHVSVIGIGGFVVHRNNLHVSNLTFEIEISFPRVIMSAETMHLSEFDNDFNPAFPIYSKNKTEFEIDKFRFQAVFQLKQSDDEKSVLIERIQNASFDAPSFKMNTDGIIDEDNLEAFVEIEQGISDYLNGYKETMIRVMTNTIITFGNPILNQLDTWRYISVLL